MEKNNDFSIRADVTNVQKLIETQSKYSSEKWKLKLKSYRKIRLLCKLHARS